MALPEGVQLVVFDMAGTTVDDLVNGEPLVIAAFRASFQEHDGTEISFDQANSVRGYEKKKALRLLLDSLRSEKAEDSEVDKLFKIFEQQLDKLMESMNSEIKGTSETFAELRKRGVKICVGSGFPEHVVQKIVANLGWSVDGAFSSVTLGEGRPNPIMILEAMKKCGVTDPKRVVKVGDTKVDIDEGRNAGVHCVSVLTGTQSREELEAKKPDCIIDSVADLCK